jgi:hypothetical protein
MGCAANDACAEDSVKDGVYILTSPMMNRLRLMLQAALLEDARGRDAWRAWKGYAAGALTPEERQIAPTLARALARRGVADADEAALQPFARAAWIAHQANRGVGAEVLRLLHGAGIETLVLKGTALVPAFYRDPAARRVGDVDILVREARFREAWDCLTSSGWRSVDTDQRHFDPRFGHAVQLMDRDGHSLDLHCHVLAVSCERGADDAFWEAAVPVVVGGVSTNMLCATDQLLHVCVHGQFRPVVAPVRWYADAVMILRGAASSIDWTRFLAVARARRVTLFVAAALESLADVLGVHAPDDVLRSLQATAPDAIERMVFRSLRADSRGRPLLRARWHGARFLRGTAGQSLWARVRHIPAFLRGWLVADSWSRVAGRLLYRGGRAVAIRVGLVSREAVSREWLETFTARSR